MSRRGSIGFVLVLALALATSAACGDGGPEVQCMPRGKERGIARVDRCAVSTYSYRFAYAFLDHPRGDPGPVLDALIGRELLAQGAQEAGIRPPSQDMVDQQLGRGELYVMGSRVPAELVTSDGAFDADKARRLAANAGLTVDALVAEQAREGLAYAMRTRLGEAAVAPWLAERCARAAKAGRIQIAPDILRRTDDDGHPMPDHYVPCAAWSAAVH